MVLAQQCLVYRKPAFFRQVLRIYSTVKRIGRSSLDLIHVAVLDGDHDTVVAESTSTVVLIDIHTGQSLSWPDDFRRRVQALLS